MANSWGLCIYVHPTCWVVCTGWTTWVGTPGAGGLESDRLSLECTEPSRDGRGFVRRSNKSNRKASHPYHKFSTHDILLRNRNNSHRRTSCKKVFFCSAEERLTVGMRKSVSVHLSFHPYILHTEGQPWTANLPRWRDKSLHLVNMQIRWEREMRDTWGMMDRGRKTEDGGWAEERVILTHFLVSLMAENILLELVCTVQLSRRCSYFNLG